MISAGKQPGQLELCPSGHHPGRLILKHVRHKQAQVLNINCNLPEIPAGGTLVFVWSKCPTLKKDFNSNSKENFLGNIQFFQLLIDLCHEYKQWFKSLSRHRHSPINQSMTSSPRSSANNTASVPCECEAFEAADPASPTESEQAYEKILESSMCVSTQNQVTGGWCIWRNIWYFRFKVVFL